MDMPHALIPFFWHFCKRYKWSLAGFILVAICWALYGSLISYALKLIIDRVSAADTSDLFQKVRGPAIFYILLSVGISIAFRFYDWVILKTFPPLKGEITEEMTAYIEKHSYSYFQDHFSGSLANKINDMGKGVPNVISHLIDHFLARVLSFGVGCVMMYIVSPYFTLILVIWGAVFILTAICLSKKSILYSEQYSEARSVIVGKVVDSLTNILNIKLFAREDYENRYLKSFVEGAVLKDKRQQLYLLKVKTFFSVYIVLLITAMITLLVYERIHQRVTVGDFALILTLTVTLIDEVYFLANQLVPFTEELGMCKQALSIITQPITIKDAREATPLIVTRGEIVFDKVHFHYLKEQRLFTDKSIVIRPGEKVGLVGVSGSGKSTFVNLILRFFDVQSGSIVIDGQDIKSVTQESLRNQIAMIPQDPALFHRTLWDNIRYGSLDASDAEVFKAAKLAHCDEFIEKLKDGYQSLVGERGIKLSGGQRQRVAIARALLKNAPILILDEATSSLDSVTENYIQESFIHLMEGRTTIVIAHRLSTLSRMNRLLVFEKGKIVEDGSHEELLKRQGTYAKLWSMQAGGFV